MWYVVAAVGNRGDVAVLGCFQEWWGLGLWVVVVGSRCCSPCGWLLVIMCVDGGGKERRNHVTKQTLFVTYPLKINKKQIDNSSRMLFLPILRNIPV